MQGIDKDEIKAKHGYHPGHLRMWNSEHRAEKMLRPLIALRIIAVRAHCSIEVGGLEERECSKSFHGE